MSLTLRFFSEKEVGTVAPWFEDKATIKWLGDEDWAKDVCRLVNTRSSLAYLAYDKTKPIGLIIVCTTRLHGSDDTSSATISLLVDPSERQKGYGKAMLKKLLCQPELEQIRIFEAGIEPENKASIKTFEAVGFASDYSYFFGDLCHFLLCR